MKPDLLPVSENTGAEVGLRNGNNNNKKKTTRSQTPLKVCCFQTRLSLIAGFFRFTMSGRIFLNWSILALQKSMISHSLSCKETIRRIWHEWGRWCHTRDLLGTGRQRQSRAWREGVCVCVGGGAGHTFSSRWSFCRLLNSSCVVLSMLSVCRVANWSTFQTSQFLFQSAVTSQTFCRLSRSWRKPLVSIKLALVGDERGENRPFPES